MGGGSGMAIEVGLGRRKKRLGMGGEGSGFRVGSEGFRSLRGNGPLGLASSQALMGTTSKSGEHTQTD